jgi:hypothetical protein
MRQGREFMLTLLFNYPYVIQTWPIICLQHYGAARLDARAAQAEACAVITTWET